MCRRASAAIGLGAAVLFIVSGAGWRAAAARAEGSRASISNSLGDIYAVSIDGGDLKKLTPGDRVDSYPVISPDGRQMAFASISRAHVNDAGLRDVLSVMRTDGSHFRTFARALYQPGDFAWSPDAGQLAFGSYWRHRHYVVELASGRVRPLDLGVLPPFGLEWSPHGQLAYAEGAPSTPATVVVDSNGKQFWRTRGWFDGWSPDGTKLAVSRHETRTVLFFDRTGHRLMSFRAGPPGWSYRSWAPNSEAIAFLRGRPSAVWVASLRDRRVRRIASASGTPLWSPDNRLLAYTRTSGAQSTVDVSAIERPRPRPVPQSMNMTPLAWVDSGRLLVRRGWYGADVQRFEIVPVAGGTATVLASFPSGSQVTAQLSPDHRTVIIFRAYR